MSQGSWQPVLLIRLSDSELIVHGPLLPGLLGRTEPRFLVPVPFPLFLASPLLSTPTPALPHRPYTGPFQRYYVELPERGKVTLGGEDTEQRHRLQRQTGAG